MRVFAILIFAATLSPAETVFTRDVAPLLYKHCVSCHHAGDIAPMPLLTYNEARPWAAAIKEAVLSRKMPPWKADPHYGKWSNDDSLTDAEVATIKAGVDGGTPEGDPKLLPPAPKFAEGWKIGQPDAVVTIPKQKLEGSGPDQYVYITVPSNFTEDKWVVAAELRAGNRKIVHHAHVFVVEPEAAPKPAAAGLAAKESPEDAYAKSLLVHED